MNSFPIDLTNYVYMLGKMYTDVMTVKRESKGKSPSGADISLGLIAIYENVPCKISFSTEDEPPGSMVNYSSEKCILFYSTNYSLKDGDTVIVERKAFNSENTVRYVGKIGMPNTFQSHCEVRLNIRMDDRNGI